MTLTVWTPDQLLSCIDSPDADIRSWAMGRIARFSPEGARERIPALLASSDPATVRFALSIAGSLQDAGSLPAIRPLYTETTDEALHALLCDVLPRIAESEFPAMLDQRLAGHDLAVADMIALANCIRRTPRRAAIMKLTDLHDKLYALRPSPEHFSFIGMALLSHAHVPGEHRVLLPLWQEGMEKTKIRQDLALPVQSILVHAFRSARFLEHSPFMAPKFEDLFPAMFHKIIARYPALEVLWTGKAVEEFERILAEGNLINVLDWFGERATEQVERQDLKNYKGPSDSAPGVVGEAPLAWRVERYLKALAELAEDLDVNALHDVFRRFMLMHPVALLSVSELRTPGEVAPETLATMSVRERIELGGALERPLEEATALLALSKVEHLSPADVALLTAELHSEEPHRVQIAARILARPWTEQGFQILWDYLAVPKNDWTASALINELTNPSEAVFGWAGARLSRHAGAQFAVFRLLANAMTPGAVDLVLHHADLAYRINRFILIELANFYRLPVFMEVLERHYAPEEFEIGQVLVNIAALMPEPWPRAAEIKADLAKAEKYMTALMMPTEEPLPLDARIAAPIECVCEVCMYQYNYTLPGVVFDREVLKPSAPKELRENPFTVTGATVCRHCGAVDRLQATSRSVERLNQVLPVFREKGWEHIPYTRFLRPYAAVAIDKKPYPPRQAIPMLDRMLKQDPSNVPAYYALANQFMILDRPDKAALVLENAVRTYPLDGGLLLELSALQERAGQTGEALESRKRAVAALFGQPLPNPRDTENVTRIQDLAGRAYGALRQLGDKTGNAGPVDAFIRQHPIGRFFPQRDRNAVCPCGSGRKYKRCCGNARSER